MGASPADEPQLDLRLRPFPRAEKFLAERAAADLEALGLIDEAADTLGLVLEQVNLPHVHNPDDAWLQTKALIYLGVLAGRSLRAVGALLRFGYAPEALVFKRRLDEIHARVQRVTHPQDGAQRARAWLAGRDSTAAKVVELDIASWHMHSHVAHADYRAVEQHLVEPGQGGLANFTLLPHRDIALANMTAVMCAVLARDVAAVIADFKGLPLSGADALDTHLKAGIHRWLTPPDGDQAGERGSSASASHQPRTRPETSSERHRPPPTDYESGD